MRAARNFLYLSGCHRVPQDMAYVGGIPVEAQ